MSDLIQLATGARPWLPTPDTEEVARLDEYNIPLAGILKQHDLLHLYVCAAGEENDANVWLYTTLDNHEAERLTEAIGSDLVRVMMETLVNRPVRAALASDAELVMWDWFDAGEEPPGAIVRRFLRRVSARTRRIDEEVVVLNRDPSIDSSASEQPALSLTLNPA